MWQSFYLAWEALSWIKGPPRPGQHPVPTMGSPSLAGRPGKGAGTIVEPSVPGGGWCHRWQPRIPPVPRTEPFMALVNGFIPCTERSPALQMSSLPIHGGFFSLSVLWEAC